MNLIRRFRRWWRSLGHRLFVVLYRGRVESARRVSSELDCFSSESNSTRTAELVAGAIVMSADATDILRVYGSFERGVLRHWFGIRFHGEALHGLQSRSNGFLVGLGPPHLRIESLIDFSQRRIVRSNAGDVIWHVEILLRRNGSGWFDWFLVSVHDSRPPLLGSF